MTFSITFAKRNNSIMPASGQSQKGIYSCPVLTNDEVAQGIFLMRLHAPKIAAMVWPGQFVNVRVAGGPDFPLQNTEGMAGQEMARVPLLRRPFSVCEADRRAGKISLLWKIVGVGTKLLAQHQPGDVLSVLGPLGHGFDLSKPKGPIALVAGGVGVAPLPIIAMELASRQMPFEVLLGARTKAELWGESELSRLGGKIKIATDDGSAGEKGFVTNLLARWLEQNRNSRACVLACGPMAMLHVVARLCTSAEIDAQIALETMMGCGFGICMGCPVEPAEGVENFGRYYLACMDGPVFPATAIRFRH
jgi:dihydroorotate dehydrogenase electron transfer subunit